MVKKKIGLCTYLLADGKKWHASRLAKCHTPASPADASSTTYDYNDLRMIAPDIPCTDTTRTHTAPGRVRGPPRWLHEYNTWKFGMSAF